MTQDPDGKRGDAAALASPGPELTPVKYWPASGPSEADLGLFVTRRDDFRRVAAVEAGIAAFLAALAFVATNPARPFLLVILACVAGFSVTFAVVARRMDVPPSGVWQVDTQGYPVRHVAAKPPAHLRRTRGVTRRAFLESVALRTTGR